MKKEQHLYHGKALEISAKIWDAIQKEKIGVLVDLGCYSSNST